MLLPDLVLGTEILYILSLCYTSSMCVETVSTGRLFTLFIEFW